MTVSPLPASAAATARHEFQTLNALRGVAALTILAWHCAPLNARGANAWWAAYLAVDLFFLLSGAVIAHVYEAKLRAGWSAGRFLIARVIRLWPLYVLGTAIGAATIFAASYAAGAAAWQYKALLLDAVRAFFLLPKVTGGGVAFPYNPPGWSLFCEFAVNVGYGVIGYRLSDRGLAIVAVVGLVLTGVGGAWYVALDSGLNLGAIAGHWWVGLARALFGFPLGVLIYRRWAAGTLPRLRASPALIVFGFLLSLFISPESSALKLACGLVVVSVIWPVIVVAGIQVEPDGWQRRAASISAELSFTIYALHDAFYMAAGTISDRLGLSADLCFGLAAPTTLLLAPVANRLLDRPVRRWLTSLVSMPRLAVTHAPPL